MFFFKSCSSISLLFASCHIRFAIFAVDYICFASIRFISYSFCSYSLPIIFVLHPKFYFFCFEANLSESNPSILYFAYLYSLPDSLYSLRSSVDLHYPVTDSLIPQYLSAAVLLYCLSSSSSLHSCDCSPFNRRYLFWLLSILLDALLTQELLCLSLSWQRN
jgi:hypothetical protein